MKWDVAVDKKLRTHLTGLNAASRPPCQAIHTTNLSIRDSAVLCATIILSTIVAVPQQQLKFVAASILASLKFSTTSTRKAFRTLLPKQWITLSRQHFQLRFRELTTKESCGKLILSL
jgi:hypothetical protein